MQMPLWRERVVTIDRFFVALLTVCVLRAFYLLLECMIVASMGRINGV